MNELEVSVYILIYLQTLLPDWLNTMIHRPHEFPQESGLNIFFVEMTQEILKNTLALVEEGLYM